MLQLLHVHPQPFGLYPQVSVYNNNSIRQAILISIMAYSIVIIISLQGSSVSSPCKLVKQICQHVMIMVIVPQGLER